MQPFPSILNPAPSPPPSLDETPEWTSTPIPGSRRYDPFSDFLAASNSSSSSSSLQGSGIVARGVANSQGRGVSRGRARGRGRGGVPVIRGWRRLPCQRGGPRGVNSSITSSHIQPQAQSDAPISIPSTSSFPQSLHPEPTHSHLPTTSVPKYQPTGKSNLEGVHHPQSVARETDITSLTTWNDHAPGYGTHDLPKGVRSFLPFPPLARASWDMGGERMGSTSVPREQDDQFHVLHHGQLLPITRPYTPRVPNPNSSSHGDNTLQPWPKIHPLESQALQTSLISGFHQELQTHSGYNQSSEYEYPSQELNTRLVPPSSTSTSFHYTTTCEHQLSLFIPQLPISTSHDPYFIPQSTPIYPYPFPLTQDININLPTLSKSAHTTIPFFPSPNTNLQTQTPGNTLLNTAPFDGPFSTVPLDISLRGQSSVDSSLSFDLGMGGGVGKDSYGGGNGFGNGEDNFGQQWPLPEESSHGGKGVYTGVGGVGFVETVAQHNQAEVIGLGVAELKEATSSYTTIFRNPFSPEKIYPQSQQSVLPSTSSSSLSLTSLNLYPANNQPALPNLHPESFPDQQNGYPQPLVQKLSIPPSSFTRTMPNSDGGGKRKSEPIISVTSHNSAKRRMSNDPFSSTFHDPGMEGWIPQATGKGKEKEDKGLRPDGVMWGPGTGEEGFGNDWRGIDFGVVGSENFNLGLTGNEARVSSSEGIEKMGLGGSLEGNLGGDTLRPSQWEYSNLPTSGVHLQDVVGTGEEVSSSMFFPLTEATNTSSEEGDNLEHGTNQISWEGAPVDTDGNIVEGFDQLWWSNGAEAFQPLQITTSNSQDQPHIIPFTTINPIEPLPTQEDPLLTDLTQRNITSTSTVHRYPPPFLIPSTNLADPEAIPNHPLPQLTTTTTSIPLTLASPPSTTHETPPPLSRLDIGAEIEDQIVINEFERAKRLRERRNLRWGGDEIARGGYG